MPINIETGEPLGLEGATLGYRLDYKGRSVLFSGDTRSTPSSEIITLGKGVDVLIHETQVPANRHCHVHVHSSITTSV